MLIKFPIAIYIRSSLWSHFSSLLEVVDELKDLVLSGDDRAVPHASSWWLEQYDQELNSDRMGERRGNQHCILIRKQVYLPFLLSLNLSLLPQPSRNWIFFFEISKWWNKMLFHYLLHSGWGILPQFIKTTARLLWKDSDTLKMSILRSSAQKSRRISEHLLIRLLFCLHKTQMFENVCTLKWWCNSIRKPKDWKMLHHILGICTPGVMNLEDI